VTPRRGLRKKSVKLRVEQGRDTGGHTPVCRAGILDCCFPRTADQAKRLGISLQVARGGREQGSAAGALGRRGLVDCPSNRPICGMVENEKWRPFAGPYCCPPPRKQTLKSMSFGRARRLYRSRADVAGYWGFFGRTAVVNFFSFPPCKTTAWWMDYSAAPRRAPGPAAIPASVGDDEDALPRISLDSSPTESITGRRRKTRRVREIWKSKAAVGQLLERLSSQVSARCVEKTRTDCLSWAGPTATLDRSRIGPMFQAVDQGSRQRRSGQCMN